MSTTINGNGIVRTRGARYERVMPKMMHLQVQVEGGSHVRNIGS